MHRHEVDAKPDSLILLDQPSTVLLLGVEMFWSDLSLALHSKRERGRTCGVSWSYHLVTSNVMHGRIPFLAPVYDVDWTTLTIQTDVVVILHYVTYTDQIIRYERPKLVTQAGLLANSTLAIAKMRLIGEQILVTKRSG